MEKRSPVSAAMVLLVVTPARSHPGSPAGSCPSRQPPPAAPGDADSGSLLATALLVGPSARDCAKQLKKWDFCFCIKLWGHAAASGGL